MSASSSSFDIRAFRIVKGSLAKESTQSCWCVEKEEVVLSTTSDFGDERRHKPRRTLLKFQAFQVYSKSVASALK